MPEKQYLCIDQKSFYATVECVARGLDPTTTNLVVADPTRSENTIGADVQFASIFTHFQKLCAFSLQMRILNGVIRYINFRR